MTQTSQMNMRRIARSDDLSYVPSVCHVLLLMVLVAAGCAAPRMNRAEADARRALVADSMNKMVVGGRISDVRWAEDGAAFTFTKQNQRYRFDLRDQELGELQGEDIPERDAEASTRRSSPGRGRQRARVESPDGQWVAICRDWNVLIDRADGSESRTVTTDGHRKFRYGAASWVYGEELDQRDAMWWSPDSTLLAFYEFDERLVPDHYLTDDLTKLHTAVLTEGYPKPGEPNPLANLLIHNLASGQTIRVDLDDETEWYTYAVQFSPDGSELIFNRTNRRQNLLHVMAADVASGATRIIVTEQQETWQHNSPTMRCLADGKRFVWETEKTGWKHYELRHLDGRLINPLTTGAYPVHSIEQVDEDRGVLFYTAYSDDCPLNAQLHRVNLDGTNQRRLTQEALNHEVEISPDCRWFITRYESIETPPTTALYSAEGERIATLAQSDDSVFRKMGMEQPELFRYKAADGATDLFGVLYKPSDFKKNRKYPVLIDVYGGPFSQGLTNRFRPGDANCEYGLLIARLENRGTINRGKAFESATYLRLGDVDLADQVAGARHLCKRPYVDAQRIGVSGHSYGGYMAALALLKYPNDFRVAVGGGTVSDWRNYDTIYTERYMRTPQENPEGYRIGSCLSYAQQLKGKLLLQHGMVDDNVHPNNVWQLVNALQEARKRFEMMFYPQAGHGLSTTADKYHWDFLRRHLLDQ